MGDATVPDSLSDVVERMIDGKCAGGEFVIVAEEQLILTREPCPEILLASCKSSEIIVVQRFSPHNRRLLSVDDTEKLNALNEKNLSIPAPKRIVSDDLDVTGSPLKCPFSFADEAYDYSPLSISFPATKKRKDSSCISYTPISTLKAGSICSKLCFALRRANKTLGDTVPLWIVCDGKDAQGTLFYGLHYTNDEAVRVMVTSSGPIESFESLPSLDHLKIHHIAACPTKRIDSAAKATYTVLNAEDASENSSVKVTCTWKRPLNIFTPPSLDAHTTASVQVVCTDQRNAAHQMYQELLALRGFVYGLSSGEVSWFVREDNICVAEELENVFTTFMEKAQRQKKEEDGIANFDGMIEDKFCSRRQNMDFTDLLWSVLMKCESYQDLKSNLELVFKAVATGRIRPQIHVRNKTQIGTVCRNLMRGQSEEPDLSGITPLQMLVEIGIEKIKRDYINIFQAGELVTGDQLTWFVNNSDESLENMVSLLEKLHVGLQVVVILRTYLSLPPASLAHFSAQALNQLKEEENSSPYTFNFKLETVTVHQFLSSSTPATWEVTLESNHEKYSKVLVSHFSQRPLIKFGSLNADYEDIFEENDKDEDGDTEDPYYCCFFTTVRDKTLFAV